MAGVIKDLKTFNVAVNASFKTALQGNSGDKISPITTTINVRTKETEFPISGTIGPMREWKGSRIVKSIVRNAYRIVTKKWEKTFSLSVEDREDDNLDIYMPAVNYATRQIANYRGQQLTKALEANGLGYDDVPFFSTTHPDKASGLNVSNYLAGANPAWYVFDTGGAVKPLIWADQVAPVLKAKTSDDDDNVFWRDELIWGARARGGPGYGLWQSAYKIKGPLDAATVEAVEVAIRNRVDDEGENLGLGENLVVMIPPVLAWDARRVFGRTTNVDGTENLIKDLGVTVIINNRLTGA